MRIASLTRISRLFALAILIATPIANVSAQSSVAELIAAGDRETKARQPAAALAKFEAALALDSVNYDALWRASREAVDLGEAEPDGAKRMARYQRARDYANRAVSANPRNAEGYFAVARALGRTALSVGVRERVKYAKDVRTNALRALELAPKHAGALHVMGVWNAEVMRLNGVSRAFAKAFLGGQVFGTASWKDATRYMEQAVEVEPNRLVHRVDLAEIYRDTGNKAKARTEAQFVVDAPPSEPNDAKYKRQAQQLLASLK